MNDFGCNVGFVLYLERVGENTKNGQRLATSLSQQLFDRPTTNLAYGLLLCRQYRNRPRVLFPPSTDMIMDKYPFLNPQNISNICDAFIYFHIYPPNFLTFLSFCF